MDIGKEYRLMCLKAKEIQKLWKPKKGDYMVSKASYCCDENNNCNEKEPCFDCLERDNVYIISGEYKYDESVGGYHYFYGGEACVRGDGNKCNDTFCFIMTESGFSEISNRFYTSAKSRKMWLPRQDQIQNMFLSGLTEHAKVRRFIEYLDTKGSYNPYTYSLEMLWLQFFMYEKYKKEWNETSNIKEWELI